MKRLIVSLLTLIVATGLLVVATPAQAQAPAPTQASAQAALACRSIEWLDDRVPAPWMTWVSVFNGYRNGHFWTSNNCVDIFSFNSAGVSFEPNQCVQIRLVFYNSSHNFDYQTGWTTTCGLLALMLPDHRVEFSFDCRDNNATRRMRGSFCKYYFARF